MKEQPKFVPKPGQVDFTDIRYCPVINCVVQFGRKILIVKRSTGMRLYPGFWNGISGFLDDQRSFEEKVFDELREELGINRKQILSLKRGDIFHQEASKYQKTWIVHPVLVRVESDEVQLDWEAQQYRWIFPREAIKLKLLPGFDQVLQCFFRESKILSL